MARLGGGAGRLEMFSGIRGPPGKPGVTPLLAGAATPGGRAHTPPPPPHREYRRKSNITFNDNDTVSFLEYRNFKFQPDKSSGLESDYIVMPNILVLVRLRAVPLPPHGSPSPSKSPAQGSP